MKKFLFFIFLIFILFYFYYMTHSSNNAHINIDLISTANQSFLCNNKLMPGSYGYFSIFIKSNKNINFKVFSINSDIPKNLNIYINNYLVDISKNNSCLYTENTNNVDILTFFWEWPFNNIDTFYRHYLSLNLQILFERN